MVCVWESVGGVVKKQLCGPGSLLTPLHEFRGLNSHHQAYTASTFTHTHWAISLILSLNVLHEFVCVVHAYMYTLLHKYRWMLSCMRVLVYVPMHVHIYVNTCEIPKLTLGVFFSFSPLYLLRQGLLLGPECLGFSQPARWFIWDPLPLPPECYDDRWSPHLFCWAPIFAQVFYPRHQLSALPRKLELPGSTTLPCQSAPGFRLSLLGF